MASRKNRSLDPTAPLNFLLTCSAATLDTFELAKLGNAANLRTDLHDILDKLIDEATQAALARWFRAHGREEIQQALDNPEDPIAVAREKIRQQGRNEEALVELLALPPGQAHRTAAMTYQNRNIAEGKCAVCPKPLARNSVRYCERHLAIARGRHKPKGGKGQPPGSIDWLYGDGFESGHGRQPGTLKALKEATPVRYCRGRPAPSRLQDHHSQEGERRGVASYPVDSGRSNALRFARRGAICRGSQGKIIVDTWQ